MSDSASSVIKLDLDGKNSLGIFLSRMWMIKYLGIHIDDIKVYDTTNGYHVRIFTSNKFAPLELLLLESILGDDYRRTAIAYLKVKQGVLDPSKFDVLFQEKYQINMYNEIEIVSVEEFNPRFTEQIKKVLNEQRSRYVLFKLKNGKVR